MTTPAAPRGGRKPAVKAAKVVKAVKPAKAVVAPAPDVLERVRAILESARARWPAR